MKSSYSLGTKPVYDPIMVHEAGHAIVATLVGAKISFADMSGLAVGCPVVGLDFEPVPAFERPKARALAALAGPIAESMANGGHFNWRQDGKVAEIAAKALVQDDIEKRCVLLMEWSALTKSMLAQHKSALFTLAEMFERATFMRGEEVEKHLRYRQVFAPERVNAPAA